MSSAGAEAIELAAMAGLVLDPWQQAVLTGSLGETPDGKWSAFEVGLVVARQNGKNSCCEARELAGLFLLNERLIIHSAHEFPTSLEAFRRLLDRIESCPDLVKRVRRVSRSHGEEGIELKGGQRIWFRTRTKGGGRGFTADCVILDEAMVLPEQVIGALLPTLSARPNPQVWYMGSAVDQEKHDHGLVLARIRERGLAGDPGLMYAEWSAEEDADSSSVDAWAQANPGLGRRIALEHVALERSSMPPREFAVERLGIGDWPSTDPDLGQVITRKVWEECADPGSMPLSLNCLAFDVSPSRSTAAICGVGWREDGRAHIEIVDHRPGTGWMVERLKELVEQHSPTAIVCDERGPGASLISALQDAGVELTILTAKDYAQACGLFFDAVSEGMLCHREDRRLTAAALGASTSPLTDAWKWSRRQSTADITPLVACTLGFWAMSTTKPRRRARVVDLNELLQEAGD